MKIHLHVGAHKTATTSQQTILAGNLSKLREHGVGYLPLNQVRELVSQRLMALNTDSFRLDDHLSRFFGGTVPANPRGIIISDENLIGTCVEIASTGQLYPAAAKRMRLLRKLLAGHELVVFFSIRGYADFLAAAYCEAMVGSRRFVEFSEFRKRLKLGAVVWPKVAQVLRNTLNPVQLRVWRFEDYPENQDRILSALAFDIEEPLTIKQTNERPSFSQASISFLTLAAKRLGADAASKLIDGVNAVAPRSAGYVRFSPWDKVQLDKFQTRYAAECSAMDPADWLIPPLQSSSIPL
jgi:hypothetical protein